MQFRKAIFMGCEVAQQVPRKPDNLSLSPGTQINVEGANQPHKIVFPLYEPAVAHVLVSLSRIASVRN